MITISEQYYFNQKETKIMKTLSKKQNLMRGALLPLLQHHDSVESLRTKFSNCGEFVTVGTMKLTTVKDCIRFKQLWIAANS